MSGRNIGTRSRLSEQTQRLLRSEAAFAWIMALACFVYFYFFLQSLQGRWFDPNWTTDDGLQQLFPFHTVFHPLLFEGDIIYEVMKGYLAPIHYWLTYFATFITGSPLLAGHWVHFVQLGFTTLFTFLAVRFVAGWPAAWFALIWLFHTRQVMQRLTGGLPRGWGAPVIAVTLYCIVARKHRLMLVGLLIGCLTHPPSTMLCAAAYGAVLLWDTFVSKDARSRRALKWLLLLSPLYIFITFKVVERPEHVGQMVTLEQAEMMPEFQYPDGRFPFVPLRSVKDEVRMYSFQSFTGRFFSPDIGTRNDVRRVVVVLFVAVVLLSIFFRKWFIPHSWLIFFCAIWLLYFASRPLAFQLYVPNRHLQFPLALWGIAAFSVAFPLIAQKIFEERRWGRAGFAPAIRFSSLAILAGIIFWGSGTGLYGDANFNYHRLKKGNVFEWIKENTPSDSLIAGHPTFIDAVQLFGERRALITTETYHPFYPEYALEARRRVALSLRAHYSRDLNELVDLVRSEGVDYFVFERKRFYPEALKSNTYQLPHKELARELGSRHYTEYAYREIPRELDLEAAPYQVFRDAYSVVVDIEVLRRWLEKQSPGS